MHVATGLAPREWMRIEHAVGLSRETYGTGRHARGDRSAQRRVLGVIPTPPECGRSGTIVIEELDPGIAAPYRAMGLEFATAEDVIRIKALPRLLAALDAVAALPDLAAALGGVLAAVHILKPPGADYDVSHSDPEVPFSAFVGVQPEPGPLDRLRLAEELVHECMHLQLTLHEAQHPLVHGNGELHQSPWMGCHRPTQGLLHGFFVFSALDTFLARLYETRRLNSTETAHVEARRREIAGDLEVAADALAGSCELTENGRNLISEVGRGRSPRDGHPTIRRQSPGAMNGSWRCGAETLTRRP